MIVILCPSNTTTGGAELMHQIADSLNNMKVKNIILYRGQENEESIQHFLSFYKFRYILDRSELNSFKISSVIVPETMVAELDNFPKECRKIILWASINNYFRIKDTNSLFKNTLNIVKQLIGYNEISFLKLHKIEHLNQSYYAKKFLSSFGYKSLSIGDYLNESILYNAEKNQLEKENIILYNPKKGLAKSKSIIKYMDGFEFIPLINLSKPELINYLKRAKLYIDFGLHPGKDRIPREAALYKCIVVTSKSGSANNDFDVKIPRKFKYGRFRTAKSVARDLSYYVTNYSQIIGEFEDYRTSIKNEKAEFEKNLRKFF